MYKIGIDLGGTNIAVGLVDEDYKLKTKNSVPTNAKRSVEEVVDTICNAVDSLLFQTGVGLDMISSIGIGAPGTCDEDLGVVCVSYSLAWKNVPIVEMLKKRFNVGVKLNNDANCAALAEVKAGVAKNKKRVVLLTIGTGLGSGIVLDGKVYSGFKGNGTEFGQMLVDFDGVLCACGRRGCWDSYVSASGLVREAQAAMRERHETKLHQYEHLTAKDVFEAYDCGDATAKAVLREYCHYLAVGVSNIVNILGPEMVVFGGGVSARGDVFLPPIEKYIRENCFDKREEAMPELAIAMMGNDAGVIGAAAL